MGVAPELALGFADVLQGTSVAYREVWHLKLYQHQLALSLSTARLGFQKAGQR